MPHLSGVLLLLRSVIVIGAYNRQAYHMDVLLKLVYEWNSSWHTCPELVLQF